MRWWNEGTEVEAEGYGRAVIEQAAQFDTLVMLRLPNGETAWTDIRLCEPLDS